MVWTEIVKRPIKTSNNSLAYCAIVIIAGSKKSLYSSKFHLMKKQTL